MSNEHRESITKLAGEDLYAKIDELISQKSEAIHKGNVLRQEHDALQAQVSELKQTNEDLTGASNGWCDEYNKQKGLNAKLESAYALLKAAIDKKAIVRSKASFVSQVKEAFVEAEKTLEAK